MRKGLTLFIACVVSVICCHAQWSKGFKTNEVSLSYGYLTNVKINDSYTEIVATSLATKIGYLSSSNESYTGAITLQYLHRRRKWLSFGIALSYEAGYQDCMNTTKSDKKTTKYGEMTSRCISAVPTFRFNWYYGRNIGLYTKLAGGMTFLVNKYKDTSGNGDIIEGKNNHLGAYQLSPIGVQIGSKSIVGFLEVGYGNQGLVQAGVAYKYGY